jgi:hypothetical protein
MRARGSYRQLRSKLYRLSGHRMSVWYIRHCTIKICDLRTLTCSHVFFSVDLRGDDAAEARAKLALAHRRLGGDFEAKIGTRAHLLLAPLAVVEQLLWAKQSADSRKPTDEWLVENDVEGNFIRGREFRKTFISLMKEPIK